MSALTNEQRFKTALLHGESLGVKVLRVRQFSNNDADSYLSVVLADRGTLFDPYVTWLMNTSGPSPFFAHGHYFDELIKASFDFEERK